jgi:hypothetical protein
MILKLSKLISLIISLTHWFSGSGADFNFSNPNVKGSVEAAGWSIGFQEGFGTYRAWDIFHCYFEGLRGLVRHF